MVCEKANTDLRLRAAGSAVYGRCVRRAILEHDWGRGFACKGAQGNQKPFEVIETESGKYKLVKLHNGGCERGQDIFFEYFGSGYYFLDADGNVLN